MNCEDKRTAQLRDIHQIDCSAPPPTIRSLQPSQPDPADDLWLAAMERDCTCLAAYCRQEIASDRAVRSPNGFKVKVEVGSKYLPFIIDHHNPNTYRTNKDLYHKCFADINLDIVAVRKMGEYEYTFDLERSKQRL
uniref:Uncharacterized protein n=1 Tax=Craspedostauros australis TaxID=1486917 RepID=A0A7R9ZRI3_9STRA|mmetsp:Transcript_7078/g.19217  ORF Transcript_7078/g.19217 Transcript_7078/m.19217 type:complete len:136 (+) Transcript_7078:184-591(+)